MNYILLVFIIQIFAILQFFPMELLQKINLQTFSPLLEGEFACSPDHLSAPYLKIVVPPSQRT